MEEINKKDRDLQAESDKKSLSWLEMDEETLFKLTDVSVCMYKRQSSNDTLL